MNKNDLVRKSELKNQRSNKINGLMIVVDGMTFNADEASQDRMVRSIMTMSLNETTQWVLADGSAANVSRAQLLAVLKQARIEQTKIWISTKD